MNSLLQSKIRPKNIQVLLYYLFLKKISLFFSKRKMSLSENSVICFPGSESFRGRTAA